MCLLFRPGRCAFTIYILRVPLCCWQAVKTITSASTVYARICGACTGSYDVRILRPHLYTARPRLVMVAAVRPLALATVTLVAVPWGTTRRCPAPLGGGS